MFLHTYVLEINNEKQIKYDGYVINCLSTYVRT